MAQYLPVLACPVMMGLMALVMFVAGRNKTAPVPPSADVQSRQIADLEAEIDALKTELRSSPQHRVAP